MTTKTKTPSPEKVLQLALSLSTADLQWLAEQLNKLLDEELLPEQATVDEAIDLYLADKCSLGRAAELAGVTRWEIQDILAERGTPASLGSDLPMEDIDAMIDMLEADYAYS